MTRGTGLGCLIVISLGASLAAGQQASFRGATHTVSVYATVLDGGLRLAADLTAADFEVFDNGVRQDLTVFANSLQPITVVVMLDRSGSVQSQFGVVRDAAAEFVDHLLPDDRARIGSFSEHIEILPATFTADRGLLHEILDHGLQDPGPTPLWNATAAAMDALAGEDGRRVVLVFTDGHDTPGAGENVAFEVLRARAQLEEVMVYAIGLSTERCGGMINPGPPPLPPGGIRFQLGRRPATPQPPFTVAPCGRSAPDPDLRALAAVGGGGYFELDDVDDLRETFARVADELHQQYLLAFAAPVLDDTVHRIEVRVRVPGVSVRARSSYVASAR